MESKQKQKTLNYLKNLFEHTLDLEVIRTVAIAFEYDRERSSKALLEMSNHVKENPKVKVVKSKKSQELERIVNDIRRGYKVLVILRGLPGSGKSKLAMTIADGSLGPGNNQRHVFSTDDYFIIGGKYVYECAKIGEAHEWNQRRAFQAMSKGLSPVIIDNTNTQMWEMKAYAMMATDYGYLIEIIEPDTWWLFNDKELAKRNCHNVDRSKIKEMLDRFDRNVTTQLLLNAYNLSYKFQKPPQLRLIPPILQSVNFETVDLMEFSDVNNCKTNGDNYFNESSNPIDEILMCNDESMADVLQPNQATITNAAKVKTPDLENAWGIDEKALRSWGIVTPIDDNISKTQCIELTENITNIETKDNSTTIDNGDFCDGNLVPFGYRVILAQNRDINAGLTKTVLPPRKKILIDQSCITDDFVTDENRIKDLMDLFPKVSKSALQELFNKCHKNFHWTVDLLLEDNNLEMDEEVEVEESEMPVVPTDKDGDDLSSEVGHDPKNFKQKVISEDSLELKKCLEEKFHINPEHYSEHLRRIKYGNNLECLPSTSTAAEEVLDESDTDSNEDDDPKNMIELNLGEVFVQQLETVFGGDQVFPQGYQPVVQMPLNLLRQIYSFYVESICQQMDTQNTLLTQLVKEDEDFARKLQEQEDSQAANKPMTFSEIVDEQVALNVHQKSIDKWKNMTADTFAIKLTKEKLFTSFPTVDRNSLIEILHAYNYDYNKTVADLIASVGNFNGSKESISQPAIASNVLEEMKAAESNCFYDNTDAETPHPAKYYREQANIHLQKRQELYGKAHNYIQRGMTEVACFYSELAKKETNFYERANSYAASAFVEEHSKRLQKFDTIDLHFLYVKEAIQNLDMFIDRNINLLQGSSKHGQDLFVITGRGKNSEGGKSKIRPAVITRLKKRKIGYVQLNPGLLKVRVMKNSKVTSDLLL